MPQNDETKREGEQAATRKKEQGTRKAIAICLCRTNNIKFKANGGGRQSGWHCGVVEWPVSGSGAPRSQGARNRSRAWQGRAARKNTEDRNCNESETGHNACGKWKVAKCLYSQELGWRMEGWK